MDTPRFGVHIRLGDDLAQRVNAELARQPRTVTLTGVIRALLSLWVSDQESARAAGDPRARPVETPKPATKPTPKKDQKPRPIKRRKGKKKGESNGKKETAAVGEPETA